MIKFLKPEFVEFIPEFPQDGKIYISQTYATAVHKCCCGCGHKVVTPLSPTGWRLTIEGEYVSLYPSIGNWSFPCRSHYWIERNEIRKSYQMSQQEIEDGRREDRKLKERYFETDRSQIDSDTAKPEDRVVKDSLWESLKNWFFG